MISSGLIKLSASLLWLCLIDGSDVTQTQLLWRKKGESATMNCSHTKDATYIQMYWYRQLPGEGIKQIVYTVPSSKPEYGSGFSEDKFPAKKSDAQTGSLTVEELLPEDSGVYFCAVSQHREAYFGSGTKLTVLEKKYNVTAPTVKILPPSSKECKNKKKTLVCVASGFYPDHVSVFWQIDEVTETNGVATDNNAVRKNESYSITSRLRVSAKDWRSRTFTCTVTFFNGTDYKQYSDSLKGAAGEGEGESFTKENYVRTSQAGKLSYAVFLAKSSLYALFITALVWKLKNSSGKQSN
ncbi:immunoglobulin lambda-1 light chain-like [Myripristis murdjan]|uniref:immunoglobulin lambda-1 light chain-like n=1 Tax=Myripristis murdjan TaxID=586833 RepID=UPI001175DFED|nr:immunoglobulin lambda-1 light chain-like [Myripristis murdjan]